MAHQIIVLDRHEVVRAVLGDGPSACPILEDLHTERLDDAGIFYEFSIPADHPDAQAVAPEGYVIIRDLDGLLQQLRIKTVEDEMDADGKRVRRVTCENAALELNGAIIRPQTWTGATASQALTNALSGTRWQPGVVEWAGSRTITIDGYKTVTEVLHQIASEFGLEIRWRVEWQDGRIVARYVDLLQRRGRYTGKRFGYSKDITGLRRIEDTTELVTAMIGLGRADDQGNRLTFAGVSWSKANGDPADKPQGQDWVGDEDALQRWGLPGGRHIFGLYDDPDEGDPVRLLQKTWDALQQRVQSRYTYEVDVALLERVAGLEHEAVRLGDTVTVHDTSVDPPLILEARVIEIQRSYVDPARDKVVLGYYRPLLTSLPDVVADLQRRLNQRQGVWDSKEAPIVKSPTPPDNPTDGMLWLNTAQVPNVLYRYDGALAQWVKATPTQPGEVGAEKQVTKGGTAPSNPQVGDLWLDTSTVPNVLKRWNGSSWEKATPTAPGEVGAEKQVVKSATAPSNPQPGDLWLDTSKTPNVLYRWSGSAWVKATPTAPGEVGAEKQVTKSATAPSNPAVGDLWLDTSVTPNVLKRWDGTSWVKATPTAPAEVGAEKTITKSNTAPASPAVGDLWLDTSVTPNVLKRWTGSAWVKATPTTATEVGAEIAVTKGATPPSNPQVGQLWLDTSTTPNVWKRWDGTAWVKATPTTASEVGAETPEGAQQKADQAEQNAKDAVASGQVPLPTSALQGVIDAALNMIRATQAWVYIDKNGLIVYNHQDPAQATKAVRVGAGGILLANSKTNGQWNWRTAITGDGIVASEVRVGTMLFDNVRGGTAELGGSGNGNGLLIVRDASGNERARLDSAGITVVDANFLLRESRSNTIQSIVATTNLVNDHSFEMIPRKGNADAYQTFEVDETYMGNIYWWQPLPSPNKTVNPRVLSTYGTDAPQMALFDFQAVVVRGTNQYVWRQYVPIDHAAGLAGPYTVSAHCAAYGATTTNTTVYVDVYAVDDTFSHIALLGWATIPITASEKFKWKRGFTTFRNLPSGTSFLEIQIWSSPDVPVLCDGVQLVVAPYPVVYDPESALWRHARNLAGYVNVEAIETPPSIRITRLSAQGIPSGSATPIYWQGRYGGYNSAGMWSPDQSDLSRIYFPKSGKYLIICTVRWASWAGGYRLLAIRKVGSSGTVNVAKVQQPGPTSGENMYQQISAMAHFNAGDYIQVVALHNQGNTINLEIEEETAPVLQVYYLGI